jgi:hypothetical protein
MKTEQVLTCIYIRFIWFSVCPPDMRVSAGFFIPKETTGVETAGA